MITDFTALHRGVVRLTSLRNEKEGSLHIEVTYPKSANLLLVDLNDKVSHLQSDSLGL